MMLMTRNQMPAVGIKPEFQRGKAQAEAAMRLERTTQCRRWLHQQYCKG